MFFQEYYRHIPMENFGFKASGNIEVHVTSTFCGFLKTKTGLVNIFAFNRKCTKIFLNHIQTLWEIK